MRASMPGSFLGSYPAWGVCGQNLGKHTYIYIYIHTVCIYIYIIYCMYVYIYIYVTYIYVCILYRNLLLHKIIPDTWVFVCVFVDIHRCRKTSAAVLQDQIRKFDLRYRWVWAAVDLILNSLTVHETWKPSMQPSNNFRLSAGDTYCYV